MMISAGLMAWSTNSSFGLKTWLLAGEFHTAQAGEGFFHFKLVGQKADHQVDLILVGDGDDHFRIADAPWISVLGKQPLPRMASTSSFSIDALNFFGIGINDRNIVAFVGKLLSQVEAYNAGADNENIHRNVAGLEVGTITME